LKPFLSPIVVVVFLVTVFGKRMILERKKPTEDAMVGYESLAWIKDKNGKEYVCPIDVLKGDTSDRFELNEEERRDCMDVNMIIGTERW
jgi:hypothetical protein